MKFIEGNLSAAGKKFGIVVSRFNEFLTKNLLEGAADCLKRHGAKDEHIEAVWVPGAFEITFAARRMLQSGKYDGIICLAVIVRGSTPHFDYLAGQVTRTLGQMNNEGKTPVSYGIVTAENIEQAIERAGTKMGNKGWQAAQTVIEMVQLAAELK